MEEDRIKELKFEQKFYLTNININSEFVSLINSIKLRRVDSHHTSYFDTNENVDLSKLIFKFLENDFILFLKHLNLKTFKLINWWVQKYNKDDFFELHTHGISKNLYSFVLYIDCTEDSAPINFYPPLYPYYMEKPIVIKPTKGMFILFPSYLPHSVSLNNDFKRLILSGNITCHG